MTFTPTLIQLEGLESGLIKEQNGVFAVQLRSAGGLSGSKECHERRGDQ
jgi:hypothetical protein